MTVSVEPVRARWRFALLPRTNEAGAGRLRGLRFYRLRLMVQHVMGKILFSGPFERTSHDLHLPKESEIPERFEDLSAKFRRMS